MGKHIFILTACTCEAALTKTVARSICEGLTSMVKKTLTYTEILKVKETKTTETNKRSAGGGCVQREEAVKREDRVSQDFVFAPVIEYHVCGLFIYPHFISRIAVTAKIKKLSTETCLRWRLKWSVFRRGQTVPLLSKSSLSCRASRGDGQMFCKCVITSRKCESCTDVPVCWGNKADLFLHLLLQLEFLVLSVI